MSKTNKRPYTYTTSTDRFERRLKILSLLAQKPTYNSTELSQILNISRRTIYRDRKLLEELGIATKYQDCHVGISAIRKRRIRMPLVAWIYVYYQLASLKKETMLVDLNGLDLWLHIIESAPSNMKERINSIPERFHLVNGMPSLDKCSTMIHRIFEDILYFKAFRCTYRKQATLIRPYGVFYDNNWYLIARSSYHRKRLTLKMNLIKNYSASDIRFDDLLNQGVHWDSYFEHVANGKVA